MISSIHANLVALENDILNNGNIDRATAISKMMDLLNVPDCYQDSKLFETMKAIVDMKQTTSQTPLTPQQQQYASESEIYPLLFKFIENYKKEYFDDNLQIWFAFFSRFFGEENSSIFLEEFKKYFKETVCPLEFIWDFLQQMYQNDEKSLLEWFSVLKKNHEKVAFSPLDDVSSVNYLFSFLLMSDDTDYLNQVYEEAVYQAIRVTLEVVNNTNGEASDSPSHLIPKFYNKEVVESIISHLNGDLRNKQEKFISIMIRNLRKKRSTKESMQRAILVKEMLSLLYSEDNFDFICEELKEIDEQLRAPIVTSLSFKLKNAKFLEKIKESNEYMQRFIAQVGIALLPFFINLGDPKQYLTFSAKTRDRNKRMKFDTYESRFLENISQIYANPVAFEAFINSKDDTEFFHLRALKEDGWTQENGQEYINQLLEIYDEPSVFAAFLNTLCAIQFRMKRTFEFDEDYLWENYFEKCLSFPRENENFEVFKTTFELVKSTTITEYLMKECIGWINFIASTLISKSSEIVHEALLATQHAFSHVAPESFILVPFALAALKDKKISPEEVSILLSLVSIIQAKDSGSIDISIFEEPLNMLDSIEWVDTNKLAFLKQIILNPDWKNVVKELAVEIFTKYSAEAPVNHITIGFLFSIIMMQIKNEKKVTDNVKNLAKVTFNKTEIAEVSNTNKMLEIFIANYNEISPEFPEVYEYIKEYLKLILTSPALTEGQSASFLEIFADTCLFMNDQETLEEVFAQIKRNRRDITCINPIHNRFLMRMNQPLYPDICPQTRDAAIIGKGASFASFNFSNKEGLEVTAMTHVGTQQYIIKVDEEEEEKKDANDEESFYQPEDDLTINYEPNDFDENMEKLVEIVKEKNQLSSTNDLLNAFQLEPSVQQSDIDYTDTTSKAPQKHSTETPEFIFTNKDATAFLSTIKDGIENVNLIKNDQALDLSVKSIYSQFIRETLKIGVLFVLPKQRDQNDILFNDWNSTKGSNFQSFLRGLGWVIDLAKHEWYNGKLDANTFSNGRYHIYYSCERFEVLFHTAVLMPSDENEKQQIYKKRHIGNDNVHIVWSQDYIDYSTSTISSQFNDAHIIVYPICNDLYRVTVMQKDNQMLFGPLHDDTVIPESVLPTLVRWTAIYADRVSRMSNVDAKLPCEIIEEQITSFGKKNN